MNKAVTIHGREFEVRTRRCGAVWVATVKIYGVSGIGTTEDNAIVAVMDGLKTLINDPQTPCQNGPLSS